MSRHGTTRAPHGKPRATPSRQVRCGWNQDGPTLNAVQPGPACHPRNAAEILGRAGALVGQAVALIALLLDPDAVIIGGGVAQAGGAFWLPLRAAARIGQLHDTPVLAARLGTDSALRGAADLARAATMQQRTPAISRAPDNLAAEWH